MCNTVFQTWREWYVFEIRSKLWSDVKHGISDIMISWCPPAFSFFLSSSAVSSLSLLTNMWFTFDCSEFNWLSAHFPFIEVSIMYSNVPNKRCLTPVLTLMRLFLYLLNTHRVHHNTKWHNSTHLYSTQHCIIVWWDHHNDDDSLFVSTTLFHFFVFLLAPLKSTTV